MQSSYLSHTCSVIIILLSITHNHYYWNTECFSLPWFQFIFEHLQLSDWMKEKRRKPSTCPIKDPRYVPCPSFVFCPLSVLCLLSPVRPLSFVPCLSSLLSCATTSVNSAAVFFNALFAALLILSLFLFFPSSYASSISSFVFTSPFYQFSLSLPSFSSLPLLLSLGLLLSCLTLTRFHSLVSSPPLMNPSCVSHNHNFFQSSSPLYIISYHIP